MALVRWDSANELAGMELDKLNQMFTGISSGAFNRGWVPAVDIYENDDHEVLLKAELPDLKREDIAVTCENNVLTLKGERKFDSTLKRENFQRIERQYGSFTRSFTLPATVDTGLISASYTDGVLTIRLPQRDDAKPKQIEVNAD